MTRKVKFKAKRLDNGKWQYGCGFNISTRISDSYEIIGNIYGKEVE